jgi:hypothetical protein
MFHLEFELKHKVLISSRFDIESEQNFELKIKKLYSFRHKKYKKRMFKTIKALKQHFNALEMFLLSIKAHFKIIFEGQKLFFRMSTFCFFVTEIISFLTLTFLTRIYLLLHLVFVFFLWFLNGFVFIFISITVV